MTVKSSKNMTVTWNGTAVPDCTAFNIAKDSGTQKHSTSSTGGFYRRNSGATDKSGSMSFQNDNLAFAEGDTGTLIVTSDGTVELYNGLAYIESINYTLPVDGGGNVTAEVTWGRTVA